MQLNENLIHQNFLKNVNTNPHQMIGNGTLVETDAGIFYISVSAGEITFENRKIYAVSSDSPISKAMMGKKVGDEFVVNGLNRQIKTLW